MPSNHSAMQHDAKYKIAVNKSEYRSQQTCHSLLVRVSYEVYIVKFWEGIDYVIMSPQCDLFAIN